MHKHRYLWEQVNDPVPEGQFLKCLDCDKKNCASANWVAIPQALVPFLNARWSGVKYDDAAPELKPAVMTVAKLDHAARLARAGRK